MKKQCGRREKRKKEMLLVNSEHLHENFGDMAYGICAGLDSRVFDIHGVLVTGIIGYKENDLFHLGLLGRTIPSHWTNFRNSCEYQI